MIPLPLPCPPPPPPLCRGAGHRDSGTSCTADPSYAPSALPPDTPHPARSPLPLCCGMHGSCLHNCILCQLLHQLLYQFCTWFYFNQVLYQLLGSFVLHHSLWVTCFRLPFFAIFCGRQGMGCAA